MSQEHQDQIRRAALPEIMFAEDVGLALNIDAVKAYAWLKTGRVGPFVTVEGNPAVRREDFMEMLSLRGSTEGANREVGPFSP